MKRKTSSNKTEGQKKYSDTPEKGDFAKGRSSGKPSYNRNQEGGSERGRGLDRSDREKRGTGKEGSSRESYKGKSFDKPPFGRNQEEGRERGASSDRTGNFNREFSRRGDFQGKSFDKPYKRSSEEGSDRKSFDSKDRDQRGIGRDSDRSYSGKSFGKSYKRNSEESGERGKSFDRPNREKNTTERKYAPKGDFQGKSSYGGKKSENTKRVRPEAGLAGMPKLNHPNKPVTSKPAPKQTDEIRLNKYISNAGICSRRKADELIEQGLVQVNGEVVLEMGFKVQPKDIVTYNGAKVVSENKVYVLLNKPKDFITTTSDERGRKTVMELVRHASNGTRLYPVGRLDRNTTGLLLLTNDGELAQHLSHPSTNVIKVYQAELDKPISRADLDAIRNGVELEDGLAQVDEVDITEPQVDARFVGIAIHSGKNRIVRRIFEHLGYEVKRLDRVSYAGLTKKDLPRSKWRFLTEQELVYLKHLTAGSVKK